MDRARDALKSYGITIIETAFVEHLAAAFTAARAEERRHVIAEAAL